MKKVLLLWLFLAVCYELVSIASCETALNPKTGLPRLPELKNKPLSAGETRQEVAQLRSLNIVKRARGTYGSGSLPRPRNNSRSAASTNLVKAPVLSVAIKHFVIGLLAITFFH